MRSRNLKPAVFKNEALAQLGDTAYRLFTGLWCMADRMGRLKDEPGRIEAEIFPFKFQRVNTLALLDALAGGDDPFIVRYEANGAKYIQIVNFLRHQNPHPREAASSIPPCRKKAMPRHDQGNAKDMTSRADSLFSDSPFSDSLFSDSSRARETGGEGGSEPESTAHRGMGPGLAPPAYPKPDPKREPERALACVYRALKGIPREMWREWDRDNLPAFVIDAQKLIEICGTLKRAGACLEYYSAHWKQKNFTGWTIRGVVRNAYEWAANHPPEEDDGPVNRQSVPVADADPDATDANRRDREQIAAAEVLDRIRNLPPVPSESEADQGRGTRGNEPRGG